MFLYLWRFLEPWRRGSAFCVPGSNHRWTVFLLLLLSAQHLSPDRRGWCGQSQEELVLGYQENAAVWKNRWRWCNWIRWQCSKTPDAVHVKWILEGRDNRIHWRQCFCCMFCLRNIKPFFSESVWHCLYWIIKIWPTVKLIENVCLLSQIRFSVGFNQL